MASSPDQPRNRDGWAHIAEVGSAWGLIFLYRLYRGLGRWPFRLALGPVLLYFFAFKPKQRRASLDYLSRVYALGGLASPPGIFTSLRQYFNFAESALDKLIACNGGFTFDDVDFQGREALQSGFAQKQGVLFVGSHLGNLEACRALASERQDMTLQVLVHTRHAENFNRLLRRLDPSARMNLHQVTHLDVGQAAWLSERVERGESLILTGDRTPPGGGRMVNAPFLGENAEFPQGPWILASLLGCPVVLLFCLKIQGRYQMIVEPFETRVQLSRAHREEEIQSLVERYAARLQAHCLQAPLQWFNFYPFWQKHEQGH